MDQCHVHPSDIINESRDAEAKEYAVQCRMHAGLVGISVTEIKESYDDLERAMIEAIEKERRSTN